MQKSKKLLIIGIDGVRTDSLNKAKTPCLDNLIKNGTYSDRMKIITSKEKMQDADTLSGPGWSHILTGVWPYKHKVKDNSFEDNNLNEYSDIFTRIKQNDPSSFTASFVSWEPISKYLVKNCDLNYLEDFTTYSDKLVDKDQIVDTKIRKKAVEIIKNKSKLTAAFVYLHQVDAIGHHSGFSPENLDYIKAIERCDTHTKLIIEAVESRKNKSQEDWLILVVTDHGGWNKDHANGHDKIDVTKVFWILNSTEIKKKKATADQDFYLTDIAATSLNHLNYDISNKNLDGTLKCVDF